MGKFKFVLELELELELEFELRYCILLALLVYIHPAVTTVRTGRVYVLVPSLNQIKSNQTHAFAFALLCFFTYPSIYLFIHFVVVSFLYYYYSVHFYRTRTLLQHNVT
jgi:hypothetical protein